MRQHIWHIRSNDRDHANRNVLFATNAVGNNDSRLRILDILHIGEGCDRNNHATTLGVTDDLPAAHVRNITNNWVENSEHLRKWRRCSSTDDFFREQVEHMSIHTELVSHALCRRLKRVNIALRNFAKRVLQSIAHRFRLQSPISLASCCFKHVLPLFQANAQLVVAACRHAKILEDETHDSQNFVRSSSRQRFKRSFDDRTRRTF